MTDKEPPLKRFRMGPGGVVEHLEDAPPARDEDAKKLPQKHISGRPIESYKTSVPLSSTGESNDSTSKPNSKLNSNSKSKKQLNIERAIVSIAIVVLAYIIVDLVILSQPDSDSLIQSVLPESTNIVVEDNESIFNWIGNAILFILGIIVNILDFIFSIIFKILGM